GKRRRLSVTATGEEASPSSERLTEREGRRQTIGHFVHIVAAIACENDAYESRKQKAAVEHETALPHFKAFPRMIAEIRQIDEDIEKPGAKETRDDEKRHQVEQEGFADAAGLRCQARELERRQEGDRHHRAISADGERADVKEDWEHLAYFGRFFAENAHQ